MKSTVGDIFLLKHWTWAKVAVMQVIALTEELLSTAKQNEVSGSNVETGDDSASIGFQQPKENEMVSSHLSSFAHAFFCWKHHNVIDGYSLRFKAHCLDLSVVRCVC